MYVVPSRFFSKEETLEDFHLLVGQLTGLKEGIDEVVDHVLSEGSTLDSLLDFFEP